MSADAGFDRWYAARNVKIFLSPSHGLETFGSTLVNYHLISEIEDRPGKIRIREGRLEAHKPLVITPDFSEITTDGLGEAAQEYLEFLRQTEKNLRILEYGYHLKSDNFSETVLTEPIEAVAAKIKREAIVKNDKFAAVLQGVDDPWDVALVELWRREVMRSAGRNIMELNERGKLFGEQS